MAAPVDESTNATGSLPVPCDQCGWPEAAVLLTHRTSEGPIAYLRCPGCGRRHLFAQDTGAVPHSGGGQWHPGPPSETQPVPAPLRPSIS
jgi:hypothetical protein